VYQNCIKTVSDSTSDDEEYLYSKSTEDSTSDAETKRMSKKFSFCWQWNDDKPSWTIPLDIRVIALLKDNRTCTVWTISPERRSVVGNIFYAGKATVD
jgi:hypothetical protein